MDTALKRIDFHVRKSNINCRKTYKIINRTSGCSIIDKTPTRAIFHSTLYTVRHKSVNTPVRHKSVNTPLSHELYVVRTWLAVYSGWG